MATKKKRIVKTIPLAGKSKVSVMRIDSYALAYTLGIVAAVKVLLFSITARMGMMTGGAEMMQRLFFTYNLSFSGILTGMAEAAIAGLVLGFVGGWLYNKFA